MPRTLGVEEEFHVVDLKSRRLTCRAPELLDEHGVCTRCRVPVILMPPNPCTLDAWMDLRPGWWGR